MKFLTIAISIFIGVVFKVQSQTNVQDGAKHYPEPKKVRVLSIDHDYGIKDCTVVIDGKTYNLYLKSLPQKLVDFVQRYKEFKQDLARAGELVTESHATADRLKALAPQPGEMQRRYVGDANSGYSYANPVQVAQRKQADLAQVDAKESDVKLVQINALYVEWTNRLTNETTIIAIPTGQLYGSRHIWQFSGMASQ